MNAERVSVCGCVWRHFPEATQGWKWKCVKRCPDHDAFAGHVVPQEPVAASRPAADTGGDKT